MDWKKKLYVLGVALVCTGVLLAAGAASDPAVRKAPTASSPPEATLRAVGGVQSGTAEPQYVVTHTADLPERLAKEGKSELTEEELKVLEENGGKMPQVEPQGLQTAAEIAPEGANGPRDGEGGCFGDKDINGAGTTAWTYMLNAYWASRRVTSIYLASEFNCDTGGQISAIRYYVSTLPTSGYPFTNFQIAMRHTTATAYTSPYCFTAFPDAWTIVYTNASQAITSTGWNTFTFTTPFVYNGVDNLEVDVSWGKNPADSGNTGAIWAYASGATRTMYGYTDSVTALPPTWACAVSGLYIYGSTNNPRAQFVFPPPTSGACCNGMTCTPDVTEDYCVNTLGGVFKGLGSSCTPNICAGACCYGSPSVCADTDEAGCAALGGAFHPGTVCNVSFWCPPVNDNCADVTPVVMAAGVPVTFTGDTRGATNDPGTCTFSNPQVWHAITLPGPQNSWTVVLDYCTTSPAFTNSYLNWATSCPCAALTAAATYNTTTCGDTNITMTWEGLAAGTYYYPVLSNATQAWGAYTIHVVATPEVCTPCYTDPDDEWISNVTLNTINNTTVAETGGCSFGDYTAVSTDLVREASYPITVTIVSTYTNYTRVWIDWNQDLSFSGAGEEFSLGSHTGSTPFTGTIVVPAGAALGTTRMRVKIQESSYPTPCNNATYGETEDYTINVIEPVGACCIGEDCTETTPSGCAGTWQGAGTDCDPNPCALPMGACCFADGHCEQQKEPICTTLGGTSWQEGVACDPNPCPQPNIACCYDDGSGIEQTNAACTAAGGTPGAYPSTCTPNPCPQPGGNCANPVTATLGLADLPYQQLGKTNCGFVDDYDYTSTTHCLYYYDSGEDILYQLIVTEAMDVTITMNPYTTTYAGVAIGYSCPPMDNCIAAAYSSSATPKVIGAQPNCLHLEPGTYYIMVDTWSTPDCIPTFDLKVEQCIIPTGACCVGETCTIETQAGCTALSGTYVGNDVPCDPNPCALGACCFYPSGDCENLTEEDCGTAGGTFHAGVYCSGITCPTPGDLCTDPNIITALPYSQQFNNDTATAGPPSCNSSYTTTQNDWWFQYTPAADVCVFVDVYEVASYDTVMGIYTGPDCDNLTNIVCVDDPDGYHIQLSLVAGTTYWFQVGDYGSTEGGGLTDFDLYLCPTGACCVGSTCTVGYEADCTAAGGVYVGDNTDCSASPCASGACCIYEPTEDCQTTDEATCATLGGMWHVTLDCATYTCPALGANCSAPLTVAIPAALPYTDANQTTCGMVNDYSATCLGSWDGGEDIIYQLVVTAPTCLNITVTSNAAEDYIGVGVDDVCPLGSPCMYAYGSGYGVTSVTVPNVALPVGTYYVMVDTYPLPNCLTDFTLTMETSTGCLVGACCYTTGCVDDIFEDVCEAGGGAFMGNGSVCSGEDCNANGIDDVCDINSGYSEDCNGNLIPDECDLIFGTSHDWDGNGVPDECQEDCQPNGYPDFCDVPGGCSIGETEPGVGGCWNDPDCGQSEDCQGEFGNGIPDECELGGKARYTYQMDDGVSEDGLGVTAGADIGALAGHTVAAGGGKIASISVAWGGSTNGTAAMVRVWSDPNQDGSPADGLVLGSAATTVQNAGTDTFITVPLVPPVSVGPPGTKFFVGFTLTSSDYVVAIDQTTPVLGRNWIVASAYSTPPLDPNDLDAAYNNPLGTLESYGFDGNLMIRAEGIPAGGDCNGNGVPDDCDIEDGVSEDCNNNLVPDECDIGPEGSSEDCNYNDIPDECDIDSGFSEDCNDNGVPDECDISNGVSNDCQGDNIPDECQLGTGGGGGQLIQDPSFEAGITSPYWVSTSTNYGTVLCDFDSCGTGGGTAGAHTGGVWAWFGGCGTTCTLPEVGTLSQSVTIPAVSSATLKFWFWIGSSANLAADTFVVTMDGNTVFSVDGTSTAYAAYTEVTVDVTAYADGGAHTLLFTGTQTSGTATNFNVDDVTLTTPGSAPSNDCNQDGVPDECNIDIAFGGYCFPLPPLFTCSTDYNGNGVPDECELCGDFTAPGGTNPYPPADGLVDAADYWYIHDGIGFCLGHPKYDARPLADMDGDGCITLVDYQNWLMCYRMANGKEFVPPKKPKQGIPLPSVPRPTADTGGGAVPVTY